MTARTIVLKPTDFFHARPAAEIAAAAMPFESVVMIALGDELADAKTPFSLMRLSHPKGRAFDLFADGPDEEEAVSEVMLAVRRVFGEEGHI